MKERLQKVLARSGACSRRKAEEFIKQGRVAIDGKVITEMGTKVDPDAQRITLNGNAVRVSLKKITVLLNKPTGYVTTLNDPQGRPIVSSLLKGISERLFPVGRLDLDTSGALILTNDGDLAQRVQHPSFEINKTYVAKVKGRPSAESLARLSKGIMLEGRMTYPARLKMRQQSSQSSVIEIVIHEGRKRQVRKMFAAIGHHVIELSRIAYGQLQLGSLPSGSFRVLSPKDISRIFSSK